MKNYYYDLQNFNRAIKRNCVQKLFLHGNEFWFYTRKGIISHKADDVDKLFVYFVTTLGLEIDRRD